MRSTLWNYCFEESFFERQSQLMSLWMLVYRTRLHDAMDAKFPSLCGGLLAINGDIIIKFGTS